MSDPKVALVLDAHTQWGDGAVWDARHARLLFVDVMAGRLHEFDPETGGDRVLALGEPVGAVAPAAAGGCIAATASGFVRVDLETGARAPLAVVEADVRDNRMSDGRVDARGRFWAGTMNLMGRRHGSLYRLGAGGEVTRMLAGVSVSNGLDWSLDGRRMYYVDTAEGRIDVFDFDEATGAIDNRRPFVSLPHTAGHPDGLTVDAEGGVWITLWAGSALHRYRPDGQLDRTVTLPVTHPTSCAFAGPDLGDLYVTSAWIELTAAARERQPQAGGLFRLRPGVVGRLPVAFAG